MNKILKNILYISFTITAILFIVTCAVQPVASSSIEPSDLVTEQCNTMMNRGNSIFDEVVDSYDALDNSNIKPYIQSLVDYQLFPYNPDGVKTFDERMKDIYLSDNNIASAYTLFQKGMDDLSSDTKSIRVIRKFAVKNESRFGSPSLQINIPVSPVNQTVGNLTNLSIQQKFNQYDMRPDLSNNLNKLNYQIGITQNLSWEIWGYLSRQIHNIGVDIDQFKHETRSNLSVINSKADEVILGLKGTQHDISVISQSIQNLTNIIYLQDLKDPLARIDGFLFNYSTAGTWSSARDYALDILPQYGYILERFLDCAKSIQNWAVDQTGDSAIPAMVPASHTYDSESGVDVVYAKVYDAGSSPLGKVYIDFTNPQKSIDVGLGNIQYLAKIMLTRFNVHNILYWGSKLTDTNDSVATAYISKLDSSGIKPSVEAAATQMESELADYMDDLSSDFTGDYPTGAKFDLYKNDTLVGSSSNLTPNEQKAVIMDAYSSAFLNYLGPVMATLMQLEVQLKTYQK